MLLRDLQAGKSARITKIHAPEGVPPTVRAPSNLSCGLALHDRFRDENGNTTGFISLHVGDKIRCRLYGSEYEGNYANSTRVFAGELESYRITWGPERGEPVTSRHYDPMDCVEVEPFEVDPESGFPWERVTEEGSP